MLPMGKFALSKDEIANQSSRHYLSLEVGSEDTLRLLAADWGADLTAASSGRVCPGAYKPLSAFTVDSEPTTPLMAAAAYGSQRMYGVLLEMGENGFRKIGLIMKCKGEGGIIYLQALQRTKLCPPRTLPGLPSPPPPSTTPPAAGAADC